MEKMRWIDRQIPINSEIEALAQQLSGRSAFPMVLANILVQRGYDTFEKVKTFMRPTREEIHDPWDLKDMDRATVRVIEAVERKEKILIYGDYDVDGTTSVALMKLFLEDWGIEADYYIPDRYKEGYGLSTQGIEYAAKEGYQLLIVLDCGTKAVDLVAQGKSYGLEFIIVDHHQPGEVLPAAEALINPLQEGCDYPCKVLSACGLGLKFIQALSEEFVNVLPDQIPFEHYDPFNKYCDLVTLSIASDIVPILDENRVIAVHGLEKIRSVPLPGIAALMALSAHERQWTISDLVFFLGPRINSAGRLRSGRAAVRLLLGDPEEKEAFALALHGYNEERRELDKEITNEALALIKADPKGKDRVSTVLYQSHWHKGVIGIVASRLIEQYHRPTVMLTESEGKWVGSARSVPGFDLYKTLTACRHHLLQFGGHKYAAGMTLRAEDLEPFREAFEKEVASRINPSQLMPEMEVAHRLNFNEINGKFLRLMRLLAPFGPGNPEPIFLTEDCEVRDVRILKEDHVKLSVRQSGITFEAIGFNLAKQWKAINSLNIHLAYQANTKTWRGKTSIQLMIKDFKTAD